ncbi:MAG: crotonobetainyl-CoA:carnitine CoA-transferase CaiB-like acyl-CoA transferase [Candidatus Poriferisodalaceae bacterium]|jgi:crotonobetainyl-CoA:carnitine CoA-transferase CaiB-like acyl-CoA transferase
MSMSHSYNGTEPTRSSGGITVGPFKIRLRTPAIDGFVSNTILFGEAIGPFSKRLFDWIIEEGEADPGDGEIDWINFVAGVTEGRIPLDEYDRIQEVAAQFTSRRTKADLLSEALKRRLLLVPIATVADVATEEHYVARDFWREIEVPGAGAVTFPGPWAKLSGTPLDITTGPPTVGEGNDDILGSSRESPAPVVVGGATGDEAPLAGLKILDLQWVMAGPAATRPLADWGATIVRVESTHKVETARTIQPFLNDAGGAENGGLYQNMNAGKLGITIDMSKSESRDVILDLVRWADVVCESFSPKAMRAWGLSYEDLKVVNPTVIMTSSCLFGQNGPLAELAGFGTMGASMSGFYAMTGWPDREPSGVFGAYTDYVSPRFLTSAILAAVDHRDRTGEGQYIDLSQAEAGVHFMSPAVLDFNLNGHLPDPVGNDDPKMFPHAAYPAEGDDAWVAIACQNEPAWAALCSTVGIEGDLVGLDAVGRRARRDEIDALISEWTSVRSSTSAHDELQSVGVAAHSIQTSKDLTEDPQLIQRRHFREVAHAEHGTLTVEGPRYSMSRSVDVITDAGPTYGQHTFEVLENILGYDGERIGDLAVAGVLE